MSDNNLWYGYMEAGSKSSPVLMDRRLNTGDPNTMYLFNLTRGEIIEYKRAIIEPKLRELNADEQGLAPELKSAFGKVRGSFVPRGGRPAAVTENAQASQGKAANDEVLDGNDFEEVLESDDDIDEEDWEEEEA